MRVKFADNTPVPMKSEARYLGCWLNNKGDPTRELRIRMTQTIAIWKKLKLYFLHADDTYNFKIQVYNAIVRSKLLSGLESVELNTSAKEKLDVFHRRGLRQIFGIHTTYIDRSKTNQYVIDYANLQLQREKPGAKPILWLSEVHEDLKIKCCTDYSDFPATILRST